MKVSYAQNFEDVMLHRALGDQPSGFYVDVGAHDPTEYSVTRFFYDRGWRGINVEPVAEHHTALVRERPDDINLNAAAGAEAGTQSMFVIAETGLSTFVEDYAIAAEERGFAVARMLVPVLTLDDIVGRIDPPVVHFLKIDVEGAEGDVLRGVGFSRFRPWIVLVEATQPGTQNVSFGDWEPLLTERGYAFVWFDGLNRFYVAGEHSELKAAFNSPPNVFDGFIGARQYFLEQELVVRDQSLVARSVEHDADLAALRIAQAESAHHRTRADDLDTRLQTTAASLDAAVVAYAAERVRADEAAARAERHALQVRVCADESVASSERHVREMRQLQEALATSIAENTARMAEAQAERARLGHEVSAANANIVDLQRQIDMLQTTLDAIHASRSWRVTAPLRGVMRWVGRRP